MKDSFGFQRLIGSVLIATMCLIRALPATAGATNSTVPMVNDVMVEGAAQKVAHLVTRKKDGTLDLNQKLSRSLLSRDELTGLNATMKHINGEIQSGNLISHADLTVTFKETNTSRITSTDDQIAQRLALSQPDLQVDRGDSVSDLSDGGVTAIEVFWWGFKLYLSAYACRVVAIAMAATQGVTHLVQVFSYLFGPLPAVVLNVVLPLARALLTFGAGFFGWYALNNGVVFRLVWPAVPTGWWSQ